MTTILLLEPIRHTSTGLSDNMTQRVDTFVGTPDTYPPIQPKAHRDYDDEKEAFLALQSMLQSRCPGEYVAIFNGTVYGHDRSHLRLVQRFFAEKGQGPVYVGFVGPRPVLRIPTPIIRRH